MIHKINDSGARCVFVCLGSPKQEIFMHRHQGSIHAPLMIGLGGALDIFAGDVPRAPALMRRLGLEWLYRLIIEPKRIRRMAVIPLFLLLAVRKRIFGK